MKTITLLFYLFLTAFIVICSLIPSSVLYCSSTLLYLVGYKCFNYRQRVVIQNLSRAFPQKKYKEIQDIANHFYRNFFDIFIETILLAGMNRDKLKERVCVKNFEILEKYHKEGRTTIAMMGHCGNWEYLSILPAYVSFDFYSAYKPLHNKSFDQFMLKIRSRFGARMIPSKQIARTIIQSRKTASIFVLISDQIPKCPNEQLQISFLNQSTNMFTGAEKLAKTIDAAVVFFDVKRVRRGYYEVECIPVTESPKLTEENEITSKFAHLLEKSIEEQPSNWLWTHRRWKR